MSLTYLLGLMIATVLVIYLCIALFKPEWFA